MVKEDEPTYLDSSRGLVSPEQLLKKMGIENALELKLLNRFQMPIYEIKTKEGAEIYNAVTGEKISPVREDLAVQVASSHFAGNAAIKKVTFLDKPIIEYRGKLPVWKIDFDNLEQTSFYVSTETGKLVSRRSILWRVYDFMWMLHIMDYSERENFNSWWLILVAFAGFSMSLSGAWLIFYSFRKTDFRFFKKFN